jgi:AhpD family alkylhydroperoxidase
MLKQVALFVLFVSVFNAAEDKIAVEYRPVAISELEQAAQARAGAENSGTEDNYLRALSEVPNAVEPMKRVVHAALFTGALDTELKAAMGLRIAQLLRAPYVAAHMEYLLRASAHGNALLEALRDNKLDSLLPADRLGIQYAEWLTQDVHGVSDSDFRRVRTYYNDSQVVELTTTTCFFAYMTRFTEALRLPVEPAILHGGAPSLAGENVEPIARVSLISDDEISAVSQPRSGQNGLGIGLANSMRAMYLNPRMAGAWFQYGTAVREYDRVSREIKLQISFAVSMANNCRYCTLHQVLGLKRLGVSPAKLMQMRKDDSALTAEELAAVSYARKLTREPWSMTEADYAGLEKAFGKQGAMEVLLQTCTFAYMNHFTDGLRLPSEDVAVQTYREVYGTDFARR